MKTFKQYLSEGVKAEDYEAAIVMGWYDIHNKELDNKSGISQNTIETLKKNMRTMHYVPWWPNA